MKTCVFKGLTGEEAQQRSARLGGVNFTYVVQQISQEESGVAEWKTPKRLDYSLKKKPILAGKRRSKHWAEMSDVSEESLLDYFYSAGGDSGRVKNADILRTFKPFIGHSDLQLRGK